MFEGDTGTVINESVSIGSLRWLAKLYGVGSVRNTDGTRLAADSTDMNLASLATGI